MTPKGEAALRLARLGFRVFPLPVDDEAKSPAELKKPVLKDWPNLATTNPKQISKWWKTHDYNIAVATGQGLAVLDYDMKEGQQGRASLAKHELLGIPETFRVTTPTGGVHLYYKTTAKVPNSASKIAPNVDVRGTNGYVVAPGSTIHGKAYTDEEHPIETLPDWIEARAIALRTKSTQDPQTPVTELDQPDNLKRAIDYLTDYAPEAIEGAGGNDTTYKVAQKVRDKGISKQTCLELLTEHYNETKCAPPWPIDELERVVSNAYQYAQLPAGISDAKAEMGVVEIEEDLPEETKQPKRELFFESFQTASQQALASLGIPLIDGVLEVGALSVAYGQSNVGKSFVALDMAHAIATGRPWAGLKTTQGLVIYVAAEGGKGFRKRVAAYAKHYGDDNPPFALVPCPIDMLRSGKDSDTKKLIKLIRQAETHFGQKAELIVIDTLSRALAGGDENASTDMGNFIKHVDAVRAATSAHLMIIHHSGKDQAKGARGWSGIRAAVDTEISIAEGSIKISKQRDDEKAGPFGFTLLPVAVGRRPQDDKLVVSCVVRVGAAAEFEQALSPAEQTCLKFFTAAAVAKYVSKHPDTKPEEVTRTMLIGVEVGVKDVKAEYDISGQKKALSTVSESVKTLSESGLLKCTTFGWYCFTSPKVSESEDE